MGETETKVVRTDGDAPQEDRRRIGIPGVCGMDKVKD